MYYFNKRIVAGQSLFRRRPEPFHVPYVKCIGLTNLRAERRVSSASEPTDVRLFPNTDSLRVGRVVVVVEGGEVREGRKIGAVEH